MGARLIAAISVHEFLAFRPITPRQQFEIVDAMSITASIEQYVSILTSHWRYPIHALC